MIRDEGLLELFRETADGMGELFAEHVKLAKTELLDDLHTMRRQLIGLAIVAPFLLIGYALFAVGTTLLLGRWIGMPAAFALMGMLHLAGGLVGATVVFGQLRRTHILDRTRYQVHRSVSTFSSGHMEEGRV